MIHPQAEIHAEIYIHAASAAVWQKFTQLNAWPTWQPAVQTVAWQGESRWQEGSRFQVTMEQQQLHCVIRMVSPPTVTVWEVLTPAMNAVYSLHCTDQVGGCKVVLRCTYHGVTALLLWLQRGRRRRALQTTLEALKRHFEQL